MFPSSSSSSSRRQAGSQVPLPLAPSSRIVSHYSSSALFDFSASSPSTSSFFPPPFSSSSSSSSSQALSLNETDVYRALDFSSPVMSIPSSSFHFTSASAPPSAPAPWFDLDDAGVSSSDASSRYHRQQLQQEQRSHKTELPQLSDVLSPASSSSSFASPLSSPSTSTSSSSSSSSSASSLSPDLPAEPSYLERYSSFYSACSPTSLLSSISSLLRGHNVDHTVHSGKHKIVASFLCPLLSSLSVFFHVHLYASALHPQLVVVEGQRREGDCVAFHHMWSRFVAESRKAGLVHSLYEERPAAPGMTAELDEAEDYTVDLCKLVGGSEQAQQAHQQEQSADSSSAEPEIPSFTADKSAFSILTNLVDNGDINQQRDALRLLALSLMSAPASCDMLPYLSLISRWSHRHTEDDERVTQLARLMLILTQRSAAAADSSLPLNKFITATAADLFSLLHGSVKDDASQQLSMGRLRGVRYLLATLSLLSVKGGGVLAEVVQQDERKLLERCAEMKDATIQQDSRAVLQRLSLVW